MKIHFCPTKDYRQRLDKELNRLTVNRLKIILFGLFLNHHVIIPRNRELHVEISACLITFAMKACYLFCIICCCGSPLAAQDHSWIRPAATGFDIPAVAVRDTILIPLIPGQGMEARDLPLVKEAVDWIRLDQLYDITFYDGFLFSIDRGRLLVDVNLDIIKNPGRYEARIAFSAPGKVSKEFTFSFNLPPAKLEALQPVTIHIAGGKIVAQDSLALRETGHRSSIFGLGLPAPRFTGMDSVDLVRFPPETYSVRAGGILKVAYTVDDRVKELPLGTTTGRMDINSPSLIAPLTVNFQIIHTQSKHWIFIALLLGVLFGSVVGLFVMNKRNLSAKRDKAKREPDEAGHCG
jgi:hypothetical protein